MDQQLDASSGDMLKVLLEDMGVRFHLEKMKTSIHGNGRVSGIGFRDGGTLDCEMLVISAGIRPNIDLARMAGLNLRRGILVNDDLSCRNDRDIYAIGECAEHRNKIYGLVAPLWDQARTLAERLTVEKSTATYTGSKTSTKLKVMGAELAVAGDKEPTNEDDEVVSYVEPNRGVYKKVIIRDGKVAGAIFWATGSPRRDCCRRSTGVRRCRRTARSCCSRCRVRLLCWILRICRMTRRCAIAMACRRGRSSRRWMLDAAA